jgi:hypothetical protein
MPLPVLIALVVFGIAGIALLLHVLGYSSAPPLSEDSARAGWLRHFPDDSIRTVTLGKDGRMALIDTANGCGLVWLMGADTVARRLEQARLDRGKLTFDDFGAPKVLLSGDDLSMLQDRIS